jgi:cysteinyl-tRNA synthetase
MEWPSPWGVGAPGWHLECSVMSHDKLGASFDIHTGGIDHREIHHPNEIAQNQAHSGTAETGAQVWMHNNFLVERGAKMSKSSGGFATLDTLVDAGVHPLAYRMLCLTAHYRSELEFSIDNVLAVLTRLKRLVMAVAKVRTQIEPEASAEDGISAKARDLLDQFDAALSNDLMTPEALPLIETAATMKGLSAAERWHLIRQMDKVLGLDLERLTRADLRLRPLAATLTPEDIESRLEERQEARAAKDFAASDTIREALAAAGVEVMDGDPLRWEWKVSFG